jgi:hypothetical protein
MRHRCVFALDGFVRQAFRSLGALAATIVMTSVMASPCWCDAGEKDAKKVAVVSVRNGDFEKAAANSSLPEGWSGPTHVYRRDGDVRRGGSASLRYENRDPNTYVLCSQSVSIPADWKVLFSGWIKTKDIAGADTGATLCMEWHDSKGKWLGGSYPTGVSGTQDWRRIEGFARIPPEAASVSLSCYARRGSTGTAWFDDLTIERCKDPIVETTLLSPNYRGRITTPGPVELRCRARLNLADYDLDIPSIRFAMAIRDRDGREVQSKKGIGVPARQMSGVSSSGTVDLAMRAEPLTPGRYELDVQVANRNDGVLLGASRCPIERTADGFRPHAEIDAHRRLLIDGKPFFPIGMYWHAINADEIASFADSKFNCVMPYSSPTQQQMDLAWKHKIRVIYSVKDFYRNTSGCPGSVKNEADEEALVRGRVKQFRDHPALLAWYLNDELPQTMMPRFDAHQRWVSEDDPHHPTWVVLYQFGEVRAYRNSFDVIGTDPYPIGHSTPASMASLWTAEVLRQVDGARAIWQVPQIFNWANYEAAEADKKKCRTPTVDEIRSMTWQCVAEGATGIVYYSWFDLKRNPDVPFAKLWPGLKEIAAELDHASPIVLSVEPVAPVKVRETTGNASPKWLHVLVRRHQGKLYLFVVNDGDGTGELQFEIGEPIRLVRETRTGRELAVQNQTFRDLSKKLQVAIYEIEPASGN